MNRIQGASRTVEDLRTLYTDPPSSVASEHPEVPPPDAPLSPMILAARWAAHDFYGEDMPGIAADLLEKGFDSPALRRLAGEMQIDNSEAAEPLVARMFRELGILHPLRDHEAKLIVSRQVAREVIAGYRNAWSAANHLEIVVWSWVPFNADLKEIFSINDEINWDARYRRSISDLRWALIAAFVRVAMMTIERLDVAKPPKAQEPG
jgi:hypothetical protein